MPRKPKQRKKRTYSNLSTEERVQALLGLADSHRGVERLDYEFALERLKGVRGDQAKASRERVQAELQRLDSAAKVAEAQAKAIDPKRKVPAQETKDRKQRVRDKRTQALEGHMRAWESAMLIHQTELERLDQVPESEREKYTEPIPKTDPIEYRTWDQASDFHEAALDDIERSIEIAKKLAG